MEEEFVLISTEIESLSRALANSSTIDTSDVKKTLQKVSMMHLSSQKKDGICSPQKHTKESLQVGMTTKLARASTERDKMQMLVFKQLVISSPSPISPAACY